ncbi:hypothetical protein [Pseudophaeobacter leonis]|uniref:hypothetical protein n=1 Tax=Pseudophaeobacter leonis TaxID=1144477 RepID=UPI00137480D6|nr:hypothetical protein [Pseudophaeobacter leonis]
MNWVFRRFLSFPAALDHPRIMNCDQGRQFTGFEGTQALKDTDVKTFMDGKES